MQANPIRQRLPAAQRRESILAAALELFAGRGYDATAIAAVAKAAGITKPVLYEHFSSKQELYVSLLERESGRMTAALTVRFDPAAPLDERLRTLALAAVSFARERPAAARFLLQVPIGEPSVKRAHDGVRNAARGSFAEAILADPAFEPTVGLSRRANAELLGDLHNALLERLINWATEHPRAPASALGDVFVDTLWTGLSG